MATLKFGDFTFDTRSLALHCNSLPVELRPKTALLLRELLASDDVIGKRELIVAIWHSEHVPDQSLFQAVSELRRALRPLEPITTMPNRGYQWTAPVATSTPRKRLAIAAGLAAAAVFLSAVVGMMGLSNGAPAGPPSSTLTPALAAFANGIAAMNAGNASQAERYFRLSQAEDPGFSEAQLLLAEALLQQGRTTEAREYALSLIQARGFHHDAYAVISAMDLVSRAEQLGGQASAALEWATEATDQALSEGFVCVAADLSDRLQSLLAAQPRATMPDSQLATLGAAAVEQCRQMREQPAETGAMLPRRPASHSVRTACADRRRPVSVPA